MYDAVTDFLEVDDSVSPLDSLMLSFAYDKLSPNDKLARRQVAQLLTGKNPKRFVENAQALETAIDGIMEDYAERYYS